MIFIPSSRDDSWGASFSGAFGFAEFPGDRETSYSDGGPGLLATPGEGVSGDHAPWRLSPKEFQNIFKNSRHIHPPCAVGASPGMRKEDHIGKEAKGV